MHKTRNDFFSRLCRLWPLWHILTNLYIFLEVNRSLVLYPFWFSFKMSLCSWRTYVPFHNIYALCNKSTDSNWYRLVLEPDRKPRTSTFNIHVEKGKHLFTSPPPQPNSTFFLNVDNKWWPSFHISFYIFFLTLRYCSKSFLLVSMTLDSIWPKGKTFHRVGPLIPETVTNLLFNKQIHIYLKCRIQIVHSNLINFCDLWPFPIRKITLVWPLVNITWIIYWCLVILDTRT